MRPILLLVLLFVIISNESCLSTKPRLTSLNNIDTGTGYISISKPYYKKRVNFIGGLFCVSLTGAGGYFGYNYNQNSDVNTTTSSSQNSNQYLYAAGGAVGGYLLSRLLLKIVGNHKVIYLKSGADANNWVGRYNEFKYKDWILTKYPLPQKDSFWVISQTRKNNFIPSNINDVRNYSTAFNDSIYLNSVINNVNTKITKLELDTLINEYPNQSAIFNSKIEYVNRSHDEKECLDAIEKFKDVEIPVQRKYAELVSTLGFAKDFYNRYPKSNYLDFVFNRIYPKFNKYEIEYLVDLYKEVNDSDKKNARKIIYENTSDIDTFLSKINKYRDDFCNVNKEAKYDDNFNDAKSLYQNLNNCQSITNKGIQQSLLADIRNKFLKSFFQESKGNQQDLKLLYDYVNSDNTWFIDSSTNKIVEDIILEYCKEAHDYKFTGKMVKGFATGYGKLYTPNNSIEIGNFIKGKLNGKGIITYQNGKKSEGDFIDGKLNGLGKISDPSTNVVSIGEYYNDDLQGAGERIYSFGTSEKGNYKSNSLSGKGEKKWKDGNSYIGEFLYGDFNGGGIYFWNNDNMRFVGNFTAGKRSGNGVLYLPKGYVLKAIWLNDCIENGEYMIKYDSDLEKNKPYSKIKIENCKIVSSDIVLEFDQNLILNPIYLQ